MRWFELLLLILASFRLTHLVVFDQIMEPFRKLWVRWPFIHELVTCYWCCGIWVSALLVLLLDQWPVVARPVTLILAVAGGQAMLQSWVREK